jgi:hypothetical protein
VVEVEAAYVYTDKVAVDLEVVLVVVVLPIIIYVPFILV